MDEVEDDVLAYLAFPKDHRVKLHSTNGLLSAEGGVRPRYGSNRLVTVLPTRPPPILSLRTGLG